MEFTLAFGPKPEFSFSFKLNFLLILNSLLKKRQIKHMVLLAEKLIIIIQIFHYTMRKKMNVDLDAYS